MSDKAFTLGEFLKISEVAKGQVFLFIKFVLLWFTTAMLNLQKKSK